MTQTTRFAYRTSVGVVHVRSADVLSQKLLIPAILRQRGKDTPRRPPQHQVDLSQGQPPGRDLLARPVSTAAVVFNGGLVASEHREKEGRRISLRKTAFLSHLHKNDHFAKRCSGQS
jgi:hypothetical protein